jgi:pre-mRNA-processing factor 40
MSTDLRTSVIPSELLERIFANLVNKARRHAASRQSRKKPDAFRSLLRHMPEVTYDSTWEIIKPLVINSEEYNAIESDEERIAVFDKVIRRLKEKRDEDRRYREGSARGSARREYEESTHRDSKPRRRYEDDEYDRSRPRSRERGEYPRERDHDRERRYSDRPREYARSEYSDEARRDRSVKRRGEEDLAGERKVFYWSKSLILASTER